MTDSVSGDVPASKHQSWAESALSATWSAIESPLTGWRQLQGQAPTAEKTEPGSTSANVAGTVVGTSLLYTGATIAGRLVLGRFAALAAPIVGGTLGFLEPTSGGTAARLQDAALGALYNSVGFEGAKGFRNSYLPHRSVEYSPGQLTKDWVKVDGEYRQFAVRAPMDWKPGQSAPMVVAADSSLIAPEFIASKGYLHGMDTVNGVGAAANEFNTFVMYPIPKARWGGLFRTWNTRDGIVNMVGVRSHDDSRYISAAMEQTINKANIDRSQIFGFGYDHGGTMLQYQVGASAPGTFNKISVWSSTVSDRVPMPREGTAIQVGHSANDPTLGWLGERGGVAALPEKLGYDNVKLSRPFRQAQRFAEANGVTQIPDWQRVGAEYQVRTWLNADKPVAQEILFDRPFHGVPGRAVGGRNESFTSRASLQGSPPSESAVDLAFRQWFGLRGRVAVS